MVDKKACHWLPKTGNQGVLTACDSLNPVFLSKDGYPWKTQDAEPSNCSSLDNQQTDQFERKKDDVKMNFWAGREMSLVTST